VAFLKDPNGLLHLSTDAVTLVERDLDRVDTKELINNAVTATRYFRLVAEGSLSNDFNRELAE
jgi:hypothetical protein